MNTYSGTTRTWEKLEVRVWAKRLIGNTNLLSKEAEKLKKSSGGRVEVGVGEAKTKP